MGKRTIEDILNQMTLEEQVALLSGADFWTTQPIERLGVPAIKVTDGPNGARGGGSLIGGVKAASFPVGIAVGATWNPDLIEEIGGALGEEARSKGARVLLAPTVNIQRSSTNGRNFECYSEDPCLTSALAVGYVRGVQSRGVGATIKHFIGNESEIQRTTMSSDIDERSLREIYLPPFEAAVKEAGVMAVMSSYNRLNGTFTSEHRGLLTDVLKAEWGFDGIVMSDWFGSHSTVETMEGGLDLEMPGPTRDRGAKLVQAVEDGRVSSATVREAARRVLRLIEKVGAFEDPTIGPERALDKPEHRALIRKAGAEAMVLLKNDGILPLDLGGKTVAAIGPNAEVAQIMGGGSAQLNPHYLVSPVGGLKAVIGSENQLKSAKGCSNYRLMPMIRADLAVEIFATTDLTGSAAKTERHSQSEMMWFGEIAPGVADDAFSLRISFDYTPEASGEHVFGLVSIGPSRLAVDGHRIIDQWDSWTPGHNYFENGNDEVRGAVALEAGRSVRVVVDYRFAAATAINIKALRIGVAVPLGDAAIEEAVVLATASDVAIVYAGRSGEWDTEGSDLPDILLPGRQNELISRVAAANPRTVVVLQTGGPIAMPWLDEVAAVLQAWYPGQEAGNAITDVLTGAADPGGRLPQTFPHRIEDNPTLTGDPLTYPGKDGHVVYREGVFIGYRHYDRTAIAPLFPFGFGLSYTRFEWSDAVVDRTQFDGNGTVGVTVKLRNSGPRSGSEVVQLYVAARGTGGAPRPAKELKGFAKVHLDAGKEATVSLRLSARDFARFDAEANAWIADAGRYDLVIGASSQDLRGVVPIEFTGGWRQSVSGRINRR